VTALLMDSHVVHWWASEPERTSPAAALALSAADELVVASITWFELGWLTQHGRIAVAMPDQAWFESLAAHVRTVTTTPAVAATAVALPDTFPGDAADRIIYATAIEHGWQIVTKDARLRGHKHPRPITVW